MRTIRVTEKTGKDGTLALQIPLGDPEADYEVLVVVQPLAGARRPQVRGWPRDYFDRTFGSISDPTFDRAPQGTPPKAVEMD